MCRLWGDIDFLYENIEEITNIEAEIYLVFFQCSKTKDISRVQLSELMNALEEMNKVVIHVFNKTLRFNTKLQNTYFAIYLNEQFHKSQIKWQWIF